MTKKRLSLEDIEKTLEPNLRSTTDDTDDLSAYEPKVKAKKIAVTIEKKEKKKKKLSSKKVEVKPKPKPVDKVVKLPIMFNSRNMDKYVILSNWFSCPFIAPCAINGTPRLYSCSEQYYTAHTLDATKCEANILKIYGTLDPSRMKYFGSEKGGGTLREGYDEEMRVTLMKRALKYKFTQNPLAAKILLSTGSRPLIEDAPWCEFFGSGKTGEGQNKMGKLLQSLRKKLRNAEITMEYPLE